MENSFMSNELEEMRSQISMLKEKLESQKIVNERHIRNSMKAKFSDVSRIISMTILVGVLALPYCMFVFHKIGLSIAFIAATTVMLVFCILMTIFQKMKFNRVDFSKGNVVETVRNITQVSRHYREWYKVAIPMVTVWLGWLVYEIFDKMNQSPVMIGFLAGSLIGAVAGGILGFRINRKVVRKTTEILEQIEELQKDE